MKLNKFKVTAVLYFRSGNSKRVDWIEERLVKKMVKDNQEINEPLTLAEADSFFQGKFKQWKDEGSTIVRKNAKGDNSVIPFSEVEYATLAVEQVEDGPVAVDPMLNFNPDDALRDFTQVHEGTPFDALPSKVSQERQLRDIKDHPAYAAKPKLN